MRTVAIIPAAGAGKRMGAGQAKQYLLLDGIPILVHTLKPFHDSSIIDDIFLVVPRKDIQYANEVIVSAYGLSKVRLVLAGGKERQDSVRNGLDAVGAEYDIVVIHDGVRPFVTEEMIFSIVRGASLDKAASIGVPVRDTVKAVDRDGWVDRTLDREGLWLTQTPQAFQREVIKSAHRAASKDGFYGTDDASLVERLGVPVRMIRGSYGNVKITVKDDLDLGGFLIKNLK